MVVFKPFGQTGPVMVTAATPQRHHVGWLWPTVARRCSCGSYFGKLTGTGRAGVRYQRCPACDQLSVVFPLGERQVVGGVEVVNSLHPTGPASG